MKFVNRVSELTSLQRVLQQPQPGLVRVYGRRRLGKTELLRKLCRERNGLYLLIDEADPIQQRESLSRQVAMETRGLAVPYLTWDAFFDHLPRLGNTFVVLDEFQRLLRSDAQGVSRLQHRWDTALKDSGPTLVLCGSSVGMMQRLTAGRTAPLFGRLTADLRLRPFGYGAVRLLYPGMTEEDRVRRYSIFGGTPHYHAFSVGRELSEAARDAFLSPVAPLGEEPQSLLRLELQSPVRYNSILYEIGHGTHDLRGLESKVGVPRGGLGPYMERLRHDLDLVQMEDPVCGIRRQARYVFGDPFFGFYYRFIFENRPQLELGRSAQVWKRIEDQLDGFVGVQFERVAREALALLNGESWEGVSIDFEEIGRWWSRQGEEIDIVASGPKEVLLGEVSWSREPMGLEALYALERKARGIERLGVRPVRYVLIARNGFAPALASALEERAGLMFDLRQLTKVFDRARTGSA